MGGLRGFVVERAPLGVARDGLAVGGGGEEVEVLAALALRLGLVVLTEFFNLVYFEDFLDFAKRIAF